MADPNLNNPVAWTKYWTDKARRYLVGRKITDVTYMTSQDAGDNFGWYKRPVILTLDNGIEVIAQCDDEGNDGGVLNIVFPNEHETSKHYPGQKFMKTRVLPVLSRDDG